MVTRVSRISAWLAAIAVLVGAPLAGAMAQQATRTLGSFNVDQSQISVSGISSGGFMAHQLHVAYSATFMGAGVIAGGPYNCAQGDACIAVQQCSNTAALNPPVGMALLCSTWNGQRPDGNFLANLARRDYSGGGIDDLANLARSRTFLVRGDADTLIPPEGMAAVNQFYEDFGATTEVAGVPHAPHTIATDHYGSPCDQPAGSPFINNCNFDTAGRILQQVHGGTLNPRLDPRQRLAGQLVAFEQSEVIPNPDLRSMHRYGHVYIPSACTQGETCRLHVAIHGCLQGQDQIGDQFFTRTGYNHWAEANNIIILYPQVTPTLLPTLQNPEGCWDWWGYGSRHYYLQDGPQMAAVRRMVERLSGGRSDTAPPAPPRWMSAFQISDEYILSWARSPDSGHGVVGYNIYAATATPVPIEPANRLTTSSILETSYRWDPGSPSAVQASFDWPAAAAGATYYFAVTAVDGTGHESPAVFQSNL